VQRRKITFYRVRTVFAESNKRRDGDPATASLCCRAVLGNKPQLGEAANAVVLPVPRQMPSALKVRALEVPEREGEISSQVSMETAAVAVF